MTDKKFGPDVTIPSDTRGVVLWTEISSTDDSGITVDGLKKGDIVEIEDVTGICSFADETTAQKVLSFVGIVFGILAKDSGLLFKTADAKKRVEAFRDQAQELVKQVGGAGKAKRRDGYGQDPGTGDFATEEGGILVCMPSAHGVLYAVSANHLSNDAHKKGRLPQYYSDNVKHFNCFFPCREDSGIMKKKVEEDGILHIIAFDSDFSDNRGDYCVKFRVIRPTNEKSEDDIRMALRTLASDVGALG